jgi:hypothetical protein
MTTTTATPADGESSYPPSQPTGLELALRELGTSITSLATSNKADNDRADRRARVMLYLLGAATALLLVGTWSIIATSREVRVTATRVDDLAATVDALATEQRVTRQATTEAAEQAKEAAAAVPRIEVRAPEKRGDKPTAALVIPARPPRPATTATPSAAAIPAEPPSPAVSIPIPLPSGAAVTTGGGP